VTEQKLIIPVPPVKVQLVGMPSGSVPVNVTVPEAFVPYNRLLFATNTTQVSGMPGAPFSGKQMSTVVVWDGLTVTATALEVTVTCTTKLSVTWSSNDQAPIVSRAPVEVNGSAPALQPKELPKSE
jgi:hypothetical protein